MGCGSGTRQRERIVNTSGEETKAETRAGCSMNQWFAAHLFNTYV